MSMKLVIVDGPSRGKEFPIGDGEVLLGRTNETEIELPSNKVSRKHAAIRIVDGQVEIEDLGSSNGTYLNGKRITRSAVPPGGKIGVGEYLLEIVNGQRKPGGTGKPAVAQARPGSGKQPAKGPTGKAVMVVPAGGQSRTQQPRGQTSSSRPMSVPSEAGRRAADQVVGKIGGLPWRMQVYVIVGMMILGGFGSLAFVISRAQSDYSNIAFARATLLAQQFASSNTEYIAKRETLLLRTDDITKEPGVKEALLIDADGVILAPTLLKGGRSTDPAVQEVLKRGSQFDVTVKPHEKEVGLLAIAAPILYWNRDRGHFDLVGVAQIIYAPDEVAKRATAPVLLYVIGLLGVGVTGLLGAYLLIRATEAPIARMQEDTELIVRGDLKQVQSTVKMAELEALAHSITRLYERGPAVGSLQSSSAFTAPAQPGQLALPAQAGPIDNAVGAAATVRALVTAIEDAVLVVDADSNVVEVNVAAERMFGLIPSRVRGQHLLEAITDKALLNEVLDLLNEIAAAPSGVVTRAVSVPGPDGNPVQGHVSAAGVRQGKDLTGSAIIISNMRREEAA